MADTLRNGRLYWTLGVDPLLVAPHMRFERRATTVERQLNRGKWVFSLVRCIPGPYEEAVQRESRSLDFATSIFLIF